MSDDKPRRESTYDAGGERQRERAARAIEATNRSFSDIGDELDMPTSQISRSLSGELNPPWRLLNWILRHDRKRIFIRSECNEAGGDFRPRTIDPATELAAQNAVLEEMGIEEVVREKARRKILSSAPASTDPLSDNKGR